MLCAYITMRQSFLYFAEHCPCHLQLNIDQLLSSFIKCLVSIVKFETVKNYTTFCTVFTTTIISNLIKIYLFLKYCMYHKYKFCTFLQWLSGLFYLKFFNKLLFCCFLPVLFSKTSLLFTTKVKRTFLDI